MRFPGYFEEVLSLVGEERAEDDTPLVGTLGAADPPRLPPWLRAPPGIPDDAEMVGFTLAPGSVDPTQALPIELFDGLGGRRCT